MLCLHTITPIGTDDPAGMACGCASGESRQNGSVRIRTRNASCGLQADG